MGALDRQAARIAGTYAALAAAWIWLVENPIVGLSVDEAVFSRHSLWSGLALILGSAAVLYGAARRWKPAKAFEPDAASPTQPAMSGRAVSILSGLTALLILAMGWSGI